MNAQLLEETELLRGPAYRESLLGRTVSVVGLARSGVAACRLLRQLGAVVLASDTKPRSALGRDALALEGEGVAISAGGHPSQAFRGAQLVVLEVAHDQGQGIHIFDRRHGSAGKSSLSGSALGNPGKGHEFNGGINGLSGNVHLGKTVYPLVQHLYNRDIRLSPDD